VWVRTGAAAIVAYRLTNATTSAIVMKSSGSGPSYW
jgi:hypothetical protein